MPWLLFAFLAFLLRFEKNGESDRAQQISYYTLLSVERNATSDEINRAYKNYSRTFHSDRNSGNDPEAKRIADDLIRKANEARDVLMDPAKRRLYDRYGATGLKQIATLSSKGEEFHERLADFEQERVNRVAEPEGHVEIGINAQDVIAAIKDRKRLYAPELSSLSVTHGFQHPLSKRETLHFYGFVGKSVNLAPLFRRNNVIYEHSAFLRNGVGLSYISQTSGEDSFTAGVQTDGSSVTASAAKIWRPDERTVTEGKLELDSVGGLACKVRERQCIGHLSHSSGQVAVARDLWAPEENKARLQSFAKAELAGTLGVEVGVEAISAKQVHVRAALQVANISLENQQLVLPSLPSLKLSWKRSHGPSLFVSVGDHLAAGYSVYRPVDRHTSLRFGSTIGTNGLVWNVEYRRSKQHVSLPIQVADELPTLPWLLGLFAAPLIVDFVCEKLVLTPLRNRRLLRQREELRRGMARARYEQRFQRQEADEARQIELISNGIVILQARYGVQTEQPAPSESDPDRFPSWIEVGIVLQHRVHHERDHSRLVMAEDFAKVPGFYDCVPGQDKELSIHYLYHGEYHHAVYEEGEPVILPQADHRDKDTDWRKMHFDWPADVEPAAEGCGVGVD